MTTMGPDNLGGAAAQERFAVQYSERTGVVAGELVGRSSGLGGELPGRAGDLAGYRAMARDGGLSPDPDPDGHDLSLSRNGGGPGLEPSAGERPPTLASLDLDGLSEPTFSPANWMDQPAGSLADHPLMRGLLLELPPRGAIPPTAWLDRWFEAARAILELLYTQEHPRGH